jgi:hypothetical protein
MVSKAADGFRDELAWLEDLKYGSVVAEGTTIRRVPKFEIEQHLEHLGKLYADLRKAGESLPLNASGYVAAPVGDAITDLQKIAHRLEDGAILSSFKQTEYFATAVNKLQMAIRHASNKSYGTARG